VADTPSQQPGTHIDGEPERLLYEERRSAQRWPLVVPGVLGTVLIVIGLVLALATQAAVFAFVSFVGLLLWLVTKGNEYFLHRRTGIRITTKRLTIGAVALVDNRDPALGSVTRLGKCAFSCDWEGIRALAIVTDPNTIATMRLDPANLRTGVRVDSATKVITHKLGHIIPPHAKAVLVINIDHDIASFPEEHARKNVVNLQSPTWIVPTRQPDALRRALASLPPAASTSVLGSLNYQWLAEILG
jgi:hypothetical protein